MTSNPLIARDLSTPNRLPDHEEPIPYRLTLKGELAHLPATIGPILVCGQPDPRDDVMVCCSLECHGCGAVMTESDDGSGIKVQSRGAWLRAENRRQKAEYWIGVTRHWNDLDAREDMIRKHRAALRSQVDRIAARLSFGEAATERLYTQSCGAYWRSHALCDYCAGWPEIVDMCMADPLRAYIAGVPKSELVWAHHKALVMEHGHMCGIVQKNCACDVIGERSPLP